MLILLVGWLIILSIGLFFGIKLFIEYDFDISNLLTFGIILPIIIGFLYLIILIICLSPSLGKVDFKITKIEVGFTKDSYEQIKVYKEDGKLFVKDCRDKNNIKDIKDYKLEWTLDGTQYLIKDKEIKSSWNSFGNSEHIEELIISVKDLDKL